MKKLSKNKLVLNSEAVKVLRTVGLPQLAGIAGGKGATLADTSCPTSPEPTFRC